MNALLDALEEPFEDWRYRDFDDPRRETGKHRFEKMLEDFFVESGVIEDLEKVKIRAELSRILSGRLAKG